LSGLNGPNLQAMPHKCRAPPTKRLARNGLPVEPGCTTCMVSVTAYTYAVGSVWHGDGRSVHLTHDSVDSACPGGRFSIMKLITTPSFGRSLPEDQPATVRPDSHRDHLGRRSGRTMVCMSFMMENLPPGTRAVNGIVRQMHGRPSPCTRYPQHTCMPSRKPCSCAAGLDPGNPFG